MSFLTTQNPETFWPAGLQPNTNTALQYGITMQNYNTALQYRVTVQNRDAELQYGITTQYSITIQHHNMYGICDDSLLRNAHH